MHLRQSDATALLRLSSQRKRDLLDYFENNVDELDRWREFNAAYHEDDYKFMQFLIPPGKRVLELGCGRGDLLASLKPSYGIGIDFGAETIARAGARYPGLHFVLGDVEDPQTLSAIEGPFDYIVIADTIGMFEDIDGTLRLIHQVWAIPGRVKLLDQNVQRVRLQGEHPRARDVYQGFCPLLANGHLGNLGGQS